MQLLKYKYAFPQVLANIICFCFIFLFVYAAMSKLIDYQKFRVQVGQSPLLSPFANWVAWFIPLIEIVISAMLAIQKFRNWGLYAAFTLMVLFSAYIFSITHYSDYVPCSCGGILEHMNWNQHFVFNLFFVVLAVIGIFSNEYIERYSRTIINN
jgi:uncharacterized membrane protein YphA (DoxX/SURF4 family)